MVNEPAIWVAFVAAVLSCYCSAVNIAIKTFNRTRLTDLLEQHRRALQLKLFLSRASQLPLLTGILRTSFNLAIFLSFAFLFEQQTQWPYWQHTAAALAVSLAVISLFSIAVPLSWAHYHAEALIESSLPMLNVGWYCFAPLISILKTVDPVVRRITGADIERDDDHDASDDVMSVVEEHESEGAMDREQKEMIEAVFDFAETTAGEIMTPRTDIEGIEIDSTMAEIKAQIIDAGHSRIPVYEDNIDQILGFLYAKDLIQYIQCPSVDSFDLKSALREALMIPETKSVRELLQEFRGLKVHIAIVLDEYGGTAGLLTIEDIIEEIVGEIQDEYEPTQEACAIRKISEQVAEVDARVHVDELNDELGLNLPEDEDYDTVGGFVFSTLGHIPEVGEEFEYENIHVLVTSAERTKVLGVRIQVMEAEQNTIKDQAN